MSNKGCSVGLGQEGVEILKYLKRGWNKKEGRENKDSKKGASWVKGWVPWKRRPGTRLKLCPFKYKIYIGTIWFCKSKSFLEITNCRQKWCKWVTHRHTSACTRVYTHTHTQGTTNVVFVSCTLKWFCMYLLACKILCA